MPRLRDNIENNRSAKLKAGDHSGNAYNREEVSDSVDVRAGGSNGAMVDYNGFVANANYVRRNVIPVLLESPQGFNYLPDSDVLHGTLKALVERHAKSITGLTSTLTVEFVTNPVGGAGEEQEDVSNVTRAKCTPTFVWPEKYGMPIQRFIDYWILQLLGDPETKVPRVITQLDSEGGSQRDTVDGLSYDMLPDFTGMTVLFIEPDPTHTKPEKAWLCTNMMPRVGGTIEGSRDLTAAGEGIDHSIEFTALTQVGEGVLEVAKNYMKEIKLSAVNPNNRDAILDKIGANLDPGDSEIEGTDYYLGKASHRNFVAR